MDEFTLIEKLFRPLAGEGALDLKDDAAILTPPPGMDLVLTKDAIVEGVHFRSDDPPKRVAQKLQRVNLSDLAAKGGQSLWAIFSRRLFEPTRLLNGLRALQRGLPKTSRYLAGRCLAGILLRRRGQCLFL